MRYQATVIVLLGYFIRYSELFQHNYAEECESKRFLFFSSPIFMIFEFRYFDIDIFKRD